LVLAAKNERGFTLLDIGGEVMSEDSKTDYIEQASSAELRDSQNSAILAASTIIIFSVIYWATQIESVKELLILAYG